MTGGSRPHSRIGTRLVVALAGAVQPPCEVFGPDLKVLTTGRVRYPDASVVCGVAPDDDGDLIEPTVVCEVIRLTALTDRRVKAIEYAAVPSILVYLAAGTGSAGDHRSASFRCMGSRDRDRRPDNRSSYRKSASAFHVGHLRRRMTDTVVITRTDGVLEIRLNRPEKKNALTRAMYDAMADAFAQVDADPTLRVALLTGTGDTFTSGNDIADFQARAAGNRREFGVALPADDRVDAEAADRRGERCGDRRRHHDADALRPDRRRAFGALRDAVHQPGPGARGGKLAAVPAPARPSARQRAAAARRAAGRRDGARMGLRQPRGGRRGADGDGARDRAAARVAAAAGGAADQAADPPRRRRPGGTHGGGTGAVPRTPRLARGSRGVQRRSWSGEDQRTGPPADRGARPTFSAANTRRARPTREARNSSVASHRPSG